MLEELCRDAVYRACWEEKSADTELVRLKGAPQKKNPLSDFDINSYIQQDWRFLPIETISRTRRGDTRRLAWAWFNENAERIFRAYIGARYGGDLRRAMAEKRSFSALFDDFMDYFRDRRERRMVETEKALSRQRGELKKIEKAPQSHGGVAHLLRVLTKTMHTQGSSIYTIAKVQYAVCMQAGIYIPDEFLTDVLTAGDIMEATDG